MNYTVQIFFSKAFGDTQNSEGTRSFCPFYSSLLVMSLIRYLDVFSLKNFLSVLLLMV